MNMKIRNRKDTYVILMSTLGILLSVIISQLDLPTYIIYPSLITGIAIMVLGIPAMFIR